MVVLGGKDAFFGSAGDLAASRLGIAEPRLTDRAIYHRRQAENRTADIDLVRVQVQVAADVVTSNETCAAAEHDARRGNSSPSPSSHSS